MRTRKEMEDALWLALNISEPDLSRMTDDQARELYDRLIKAVQRSETLSVIYDGLI
jgi:hypothetical protein